MDADSTGNIVEGLGLLQDASGNLILNTTDDHLVTAAGVSGLVIVHTPDATLVASLADAEKVKALVARVAAATGERYV